MNIGSSIREIRIQKGLNQKELAKSIKISQTSLSQIESGLKRPGPNTLKKICRKLQVSESLIYIMATEEKDVPKEKRELFRMLFPTVKNFVLQFAGD